MEEDTHSHKCRRCGHVWTHNRPRNVTDEEYDAQHTHCGQVQRNRFVASMPELSKLMELIHDLEEAEGHDYH